MEFTFFKREEKEAEEVVIEREVCDKVYEFFVDYMKRLGYEDRLGQQDMALDISEAMRDNQHIIVEAGVGIGKSYAYLVPLLFYNRVFEEPVVISTSTISLQEQLLGDIRSVSKMMGYEPDVVLSKGMTHYVCRKRAQSYIDNLYMNNFDEWKKYSYIKKWMNSKGDRTDLHEEVSEEFWNNVNVSDCMYGKCNELNKCYFMKKRNDMASTNGVILCNHDLLVVDAEKKLNKERALLSGSIKFIVVDEGHNLEEKVRNSLQEIWNYRRTVDIVRDTNFFLKKCGSTLDENIVDELEKNIKDVYMKISKDSKSYIESISEELSISTRIEIKVDEIKNKLIGIGKELKSLNLKVNLVDNNILLKNESLEEMQEEIIEELKRGENFYLKLAHKDIETLNWVEVSNSNTIYSKINLCGCPRDMHKIIRKLFFFNENESKYSMRKLPKVILTSATLTNNFKGENEHRYEYLIKNIGFPICESSFISNPKESPYDYEKNTIVYYKNNMPHPMNERRRFLDESVREISNLIRVTEGKSLILFTSKEDMNYIYSKLKMKDLPFNIYKQSEESSQDSTIRRFKEDTNSVLLGTGTYWEGINVPGVALSNVIIVRLPFPVPDPIIEYKRKISTNPLMEVNVPEMIIKLRQGVGRLIRNADDTGIITILDPRVGDKYNTEYKEHVWKAIPMKRKTCDIGEVEKFAKENILQKEDVIAKNNIENKLTFREHRSQKVFGEGNKNNFEIVKSALDEEFYKLIKYIKEIENEKDNSEYRKILSEKLYEIADILRSPISMREFDIEANKIDSNKNIKGRVDSILRRIKVWKVKGKILKNENHIINTLKMIKSLKNTLEEHSPKLNELNSLLQRDNEKRIVVVKDEIAYKRLKDKLEYEVICHNNDMDREKEYVFTFMPDKKFLTKQSKVIIYEHERE